MAFSTRRGPVPWLKPGIFVGALAPLAAILMRAPSGGLGANPIAEALNELGLLALALLIASLALTPLRTVFGWTWPIRVRRTVGLLAFFYAALHVSVYAGLDQAFDWRAIAADVSKRPFIFVGFAAFTLLIPLAVTSTNAAVRRMGYVKWSRLHTLVYPAALLAVIHFVWRVKKDVREPMAYGLILGGLLLVRGVTALRRRNEDRDAAGARSTVDSLRR
jgi:methionine sulfoxide reductase heme-binding subunit